MLTVLIPAAGTGSRFADAGYALPKPLIDVVGKPMLERVMNNLRPNGAHRFIIVSRLDSEDIRPLFQQRKDSCVSLLAATEGAVDTIIRARNYITDEPLLVGNCDQLVAFDVDDFIDAAHDVDGALVTFRSNLSHHSYVLTNPDNTIRTIVEKQVISNNAVTGVYYFQRGTDFLEHADKVIADNARYKNEFYVSSVIASMIADDYRFVTYDAPSAMLGTPSELQLFEMAVNVGQTL